MNRWMSLLASLILCCVARAQVLDRAWTYQGRLNMAGAPFEGLADFEFQLFGSASGNDAIGSPIVELNKTVAEGLFTSVLDFGTAAYAPDARWMEIRVRPSGGGAYTTLAPRQALTAAPFSVQTRGLAVDQYERVGVGMTTPAFQMDVDSGLYAQALRLHSNAVDGTMLEMSNDTTGGRQWRLISAGENDPYGHGSLIFSDERTPLLSLSPTGLRLSSEAMSIAFAPATESASPMIYMSASDGINAPRMVLAESPLVRNNGLRFDDLRRTFDFTYFGLPVLSVDLSNRRVGIGESNPQDALDIGSGAIRFPDDTRQSTAYAPIVRTVNLDTFAVSTNGWITFDIGVIDARPGMAVIVTPPYRLPAFCDISWALVESADTVVFRITNNSNSPSLIAAGAWRITVLP